VAAHLDRAIELINGTQRLNLTGRRLPDRIVEARQQLRSEIGPYYVRAGLIEVIAEDDDWGYCGFYRIIESELVDYCFSRSIEGLGVESWLYERLRRPKLSVSGEAPTGLVEPPGSDRISLIIRGHGDCRPLAAAIPEVRLRGEPPGSDRISLIIRGHGDCRPLAAAIPEVRLRGGHEAAALAHYFALVSDTVAAETNEYRAAIYLQRDSSTLALPALGEPPPGFDEAVTPLQLTAADFASKFFAPAPPGSVLVCSTWGDLYLPVYRHQQTGVAIPVTVDSPGDLTTIDDDALARALVEANANEATTGRVRDLASALRAGYTWERRLSVGAAAEIIRKIFERVPDGARLFFILPHEWTKWKSALQPRTEAIEYNAAIREFAPHYPAVTLLAMDEIVGGADEMHEGFDLFDRMVYFRLYQQIIHAVGAGVPAAPEIDGGGGTADQRVERVTADAP
jgi:hypothetical protein